MEVDTQVGITKAERHAWRLHQVRAHIRLGRLFGIPIGLHYTWFVVAVLIALSLAGHFRALHRGWSDLLIFSVSLSTALLFFGSLLVHELAHALVATRSGLAVRSIVLFALGGQAQIEGEPADWQTEMRLGLVGPVTSVLVGLLFLGAASVTGWSPDFEPSTPFTSMCVWLGTINILLGGFNMLPAFPLDGGRVLRALVWWRGHDPSSATRAAAVVSQAVAYGLIMFGLTVFVISGGFGGLWMALVGWFLLEAARESVLQVAVRDALRDVRVSHLMRPGWPRVDAHLPLDRFVFDHLLRGPSRAYAVTRGDQVEGLVTPVEVQQVEQPLWTRITVEQVMLPLEEMPAVTPEQSALEVVERMTRDDVEELPVVEQGEIRGLFTRTSVLEYLQRRGELHM